jgi:hypothetical protein
MTKIKIATFIFTLSIVFTPAFPAHAALTENQIQAVLGLLSAFGAEQSVVDNVNLALRGQTTTSANNPTTTPSSSAPINGCQYVNQVSQTLAQGSNGSQVSALQEFLREQGYFTHPSITGYFGPATELALQRWQTQYEVIGYGTPETTGFGVFGPFTRATMFRLCNITPEEAATTPDTRPTPNFIDPGVVPSTIPDTRPTPNFIDPGLVPTITPDTRATPDFLDPGVTPTTTSDTRPVPHFIDPGLVPTITPDTRATPNFLDPKNIPTTTSDTRPVPTFNGDDAIPQINSIPVVTP